ncbi:sRNA-binding protein [Bosea sp. BE271]|uniref:DNA-binding protein n=1 Tax=Bosea TaxID=85413 RepID=UPI00285E793F|nr:MULTISPECIES: DNA-binding protein [Bosea]MDR6831480.1 sRNA-binding protein [Bosea robiniae]MDR6897284.1 sRNA-binding protein [Bosea sp. BE109]MDR7140681.1 sRNA-binding protein [Bosea sp. BE168]MDR7177773.1 sRNA-binding protein [Bosea sp. BE271]
MPTREDVFRVADEMHKEAVRISIRSVRRRLPNGGSYRSIGEHLADWKIDRSYQPVLETTQLPEALQRQLATLGKTLWDEAMMEAARQFASERSRIEGIRLESERLRDEGLVIADLAEARIENAERRAEQLACELAVARAKIEQLTGRDGVTSGSPTELQLSDREVVPEARKAPEDAAEGNSNERKTLDAAARRRAANEFWDRVMIEIQALMLRLSQERQEAFLPAELVIYLPKHLLEEAVARNENLNASVLSSRMTTRAKHRRFFVKEPDRAAFRLLEGYQHFG